MAAGAQPVAEAFDHMGQPQGWRQRVLKPTGQQHQFAAVLAAQPAAQRAGRDRHGGLGPRKVGHLVQAGHIGTQGLDERRAQPGNDAIAIGHFPQGTQGVRQRGTFSKRPEQVTGVRRHGRQQSGLGRRHGNHLNSQEVAQDRRWTPGSSQA